MNFRIAIVLFISLLIFSPSSGQHLQKVNLQLKWKHQFQFAGYYAAIEKGYYKDLGLQVNLIEAVEGINPRDAVFEGKAEFGVCTSDILLMRSQNKKAVVLATVFQHSPQILLTTKESGIEHVQDLVGKKIAMGPNDADIIAYMNDEGVEPGEYIIGQNWYTANELISGEIDALSAYSIDEPFKLKEANIDYNIISPLMGGIDFYGDVLFTTEELIKKNPELVGNFRQASMKGWAYAMDHPEEIIELIADKYSKSYSIEHLRFEADRMKNLVMADVVEIGYTNSGRWKSISDTYKRLNMLDASFSIKGMLYSDYLKPQINIPWKLIGFFLLIIIGIGSITYVYFKAAIRLKKEIGNRLSIEKDLLESEEKYRIIFENNSAAMAIIESDSTTSMVNEAFCQMSGFTKQEVIGSSWTKYVPPNDLERLKEYNRKRQINPADAPDKYEFSFYHKNGELRNSLMSVSMLQNNKSVILSFIDITYRKRAETELNLKSEELQKLNAEKDKFFSIIAHDLRGPFSGFLGLTKIMAEDLPNLKMSEIQNIAVNMENSANNLFCLLENLLEWALMQRGLITFNPEIIELHQIGSDCIDLMQELAKRKKINITHGIPANMKVITDRNMLQTIIRNLVSNAVKFTKKGGEVSLSAIVSGDKSVEITISDSGIGMSPAIMNNLFQLNAKTNRQGTEGEPSSGLGLLLCKEFIEKLGGKIWAESVEGQGSEFHFTLPYSVEAVDKIVETTIDATDGKRNPVNPEVTGLKILIAEDDVDSQILISLAVKTLSKEVLKVNNGFDAVEACRNNPDIDLILMDIRMPEMDGYEATRQIRKFNKEVIIIAQTAYAADGDRKMAFEAGCTDHISKPIKKAELAGLVKKYF